MNRKAFFSGILGFLMGSLPLSALTVGVTFGDNAVLQRELPVYVRGTAAPGEKVSVSFGGQSAEGVSDAEGEWLVELSPMAACAEGRELVIQGESETIVSRNVLVGEVWLCSGQSNMHCPVWSNDPGFRHETKEYTGLEAVNESEDSQLRILYIPQVCSNVPTNEAVRDVRWQPASPETVKPFSAVGFFFGRTLRENLGVPVGLIGSYWSGSSSEAFISPAGFNSVPELSGVAEEVNAKVPGTPEWEATKQELVRRLETYKSDLEDAYANRRMLPEYPEIPRLARHFRDHQQPTMKYNAMIWPLRKTAMRGVIWYQGETDLGQGPAYLYRMQALHNGFKDTFGNEALDLYCVQLAPFNYGGGNCYLPLLWEAQERFADWDKPHSGMVVINDVGNLKSIHPNDKLTVGKRLANLALSRDYGMTGLAAEMPRFRSAERSGDSLVVSFANVKSWHTLDGGPVRHFEIAGEDGVDYHPAEAVIDGDKIILRSEAVPEPGAVRYMWEPLAEASLMTEADIPLGCFRSTEHDDWPAFIASRTSGWQLVFEADLKSGAKDGRYPYLVDNSADVGGFSEVMYVVEALANDGGTQYLTVNAPAFTEKASELGVPMNLVMQKEIGQATVITNVLEAKSARPFRAAIEFWNENYTPAKQAPWGNGDSETYDYNDWPAGDGNYGSMQIHNLDEGKTVFAYNNFNVGPNADFGIGPQPGGPNYDWTFTANAANFQRISLKIYVK